MLDEIKARTAVVLGAAMLAVVGRDEFYRIAQRRRGLTGRIAFAFCQGHAGRVGHNFAIFKAERDKDTITDIARSLYSDDNLYGFGESDYGSRADGKGLLEQQRGLIIPLVEQAIAADQPKRVIEIGTGNGDVIAHLAIANPDIEFIGIDLSVTNAARKHRDVANLKFQKGYALDFLRGGLKGDLILATSTFCSFAPKELAAYFSEMKTQRIKRIVISDPVTFGFSHSRDPEPTSMHMDFYMWWHNYYGYLSDLGYRIETHDTVSYHYSYNPDAKVVLVSAAT